MTMARYKTNGRRHLLHYDNELMHEQLELLLMTQKIVLIVVLCKTTSLGSARRYVKPSYRPAVFIDKRAATVKMLRNRKNQ